MMLQDFNVAVRQGAGDGVAAPTHAVLTASTNRHYLYHRLGWPEWSVTVLLPELIRPLGFISPQMGILGMVPVVGIAGMV
jgi:hypothetical protein